MLLHIGQCIFIFIFEQQILICKDLPIVAIPLFVFYCLILAHIFKNGERLEMQRGRERHQESGEEAEGNGGGN